jgi:hypothetical protein
MNKKNKKLFPIMLFVRVSQYVNKKDGARVEAGQLFSPAQAPAPQRWKK